MKKQLIKKKAIEYLKENYNSSFSDDIGNNGIGDDIIDAYVAGVEYYQRWIPIEEEMPEETGWLKAPYLAKSKNECHVVGFTQGHFHHLGGLCLKPNCVTYWRLIECF
jgi:hypothetical protein